MSCRSCERKYHLCATESAWRFSSMNGRYFCEWFDHLLKRWLFWTYREVSFTCQRCCFRRKYSADCSGWAFLKCVKRSKKQLSSQHRGQTVLKWNVRAFMVSQASCSQSSKRWRPWDTYSSSTNLSQWCSNHCPCAFLSCRARCGYHLRYWPAYWSHLMTLVVSWRLTYMGCFQTTQRSIDFSDRLSLPSSSGSWESCFFSVFFPSR